MKAGNLKGIPRHDKGRQGSNSYTNHSSPSLGLISDNQPTWMNHYQAQQLGNHTPSIEAIFLG